MRSMTFVKSAFSLERSRSWWRPWFLILLVLSGCAAPRATVPRPVADLLIVPQDPEILLAPADAGGKLRSPEEAELLAAEYRRRFFEPWHRQGSVTPAEVVASTGKLTTGAWWGENLLPRTPAFLETLRENAAPPAALPAERTAITLRSAGLRSLPERRPFFLDPRLPGEGFPFDQLQVSGIAPGTPVRHLFHSRDGAWVLVDTPFAWGWLPAADTATVDEAFIDRWESLPLAAVLEDGIPATRSDGRTLFLAGLGTLLPSVGWEGRTHRVLLPAADAEGAGVIVEGGLPATAAILFPLAPAADTAASLAGGLMGQAYGWGGDFGNRDCSAMTRDLMTPFGIWLPRHSADQAKAGDYVELKGLPPAERERAILERGVPWFTLVWVRGHIMLYVGERQGRALVLHNLWGLRTRDWWEREGRLVIGRTVVTTLQPGIERHDLDPARGDLRSRIEGMTLLLPR